MLSFWRVPALACGALVAMAVPVFAQAPTFTEFAIPTGGASPQYIVAGPDGNLWFTEQTANAIGRITPAGVITEFGVPTAASKPTGITVGGDGNLWFTEFTGNKIGRITPAGVVTEFPVITANSHPLGITKGPDGNVWFVESSSNTIGKITPGGAVTEFVIPTVGTAPEYIAAGPDGALWFTQHDSHQIGRVTTTGSFSEFFVPSSDNFPILIIPGPGGLWFSETESGRIVQLTTAGKFTEYQLPLIGADAGGMAVGPDGAIWVTDTPNNAISRMQLDGTFTTFSVPSHDAGPLGITVGPDGALWFVENGNGGNKIGRLDIGIPCQVTFTATDTPPGQPARNLPLTMTICQTDASGTCINPATPAASATLSVSRGDEPTFTAFVQGQGTLVQYDPAMNRVFVVAKQGSSVVGETSVAVRMLGPNGFPVTPAGTPARTLNAAVLPTARTTTPGTAVTAFAAINNGTVTAGTSCAPSLPSGVAATFSYSTTDPATNKATGLSNLPVDIAPFATKTFVFGITPTASFDQDIAMVFSCSNIAAPAPSIAGLNTFHLTSSNTAMADMLSIADTTSRDGNMTIPSATGTGVVGVASIGLRACVLQ